MGSRDFIFTSESVSEGHPDKIADQISDAILDAILADDKNARVAVETLVTTGLSFISGEITTSTYVEIPDIVRRVLKDIGYNSSEIGYDWETVAVLTSIDQQSRDIAKGINKSELGAGDQGSMFGFAVAETEQYMPAPIFYAHNLMQNLSRLRKSVSFLRPDAKAQVSVEYKNGMVNKISKIVVSTQHDRTVTQNKLKDFIIEELIYTTLPKQLITDTEFLINPAGQFIEGGPKADTGLTGRKLMVDTYGGYARHGGGAFSGKDPSKVDRSASYLARYIAKNLVASGVATKLEIQISYAIGMAEPLAIFIEDFGTSKRPHEQIIKAIKQFFPLKPADIISTLNLLNTKYYPIASYGHFGRTDIQLPWESLDKVDTLRDFFSL